MVGSESAPSSEQTAVSSPGYEPANPIQASIADHKSGWLSLFSSRTLSTKLVTDESGAKDQQMQDAAGMEVMDIDDEPSPTEAIEIPVRGKQSAAPSAAASPASKTLSVLSASPPPKSPAKKKKQSPPPPLKEREPKKQDPPAPPLTDSESIKRDTTRPGGRSPSPAAGKSGATTPTTPGSAKPAAPNLVLPTWADTFHAPPRALRPPQPPQPRVKSKITGALSFVAGALFSHEAGSGSGGSRGRAGGKGKQREREGSWAGVPADGMGAGAGPEFVAYGQELPKALDVLGEQLNPYILSGGCRVAVIGVAGWSPGQSWRPFAERVC